MSRKIVAWALAALTAVAVVGCSSNVYDPHADSAKLASYAAVTKYPAGSPTEPAAGMTCTVDGDGAITIRNGSDMNLSGFDLWVNKSFVLQVNDPLAAKSTKVFPADLFYNSTGSNLTTVKSDSISLVEIATGGKLLAVAGPIKE